MTASGATSVGSGRHSLGLKAFYGDLNCDGTANFGDIDSFVALLVGGGDGRGRAAEGRR
jgi:hypothetical protein